MAEHQLANLVDMDSPKAVLEEVLTIASRAFPASVSSVIRSSFYEAVALYQGNWQEIRACNTDYHNLKHITDCFLAMVRLIHGALEAGLDFSARQIHQGVAAALLHDVGYLQDRDDANGTGAKHTRNHVKRSMEFIQRYHARFGIRKREAHDCVAMVHCTDLSADINTVRFEDPRSEPMGKILATADLLAQMADRTYLEKLLLLYHELEEARIDDYRDDLHLLRQSEAFHQHMMQRIESQLDSSNRLMIYHFRSRWNIDADLYKRAIDNQQAYLQKILDDPAGEDPRDRLRRGRIVEKVKRRSKLWTDALF
jgi:hypothetical protein